MSRSATYIEASNMSNNTAAGTTTMALVIGAASVAPRPQELYVVGILLSTPTSEVSAVEYSDGTGQRLARATGADTAAELWVVSGFSGTVGDNTVMVTLSAGSPCHGRVIRLVQGAVLPSPLTVTDTAVAQGATGPATPGVVTPTETDESQLALAVVGWFNGTAPTWTNSPGGDEGWHLIAGNYSSVAYLTIALRRVSSLSDHTVSGTTTARWAAAAAIVDLPAPTPESTHVYKGRSKMSLDTTGAS